MNIKFKYLNIKFNKSLKIIHTSYVKHLITESVTPTKNETLISMT